MIRQKHICWHVQLGLNMYHNCNIYYVFVYNNAIYVSTEVKDPSPMVKQPRQIPKRVDKSEGAELFSETAFDELYASQAKMRKELDEVGIT